ncbi:MAG: SpoIIE family protein phosphatase [Flavobacteriales bacterium]
MKLITVRNKIIAVVIGIILIFAPFIFIYFPNKQKDLLVESYNQEVKHIAATVALGVNIALKEQNFSGVEMAMQYAKSDKRLTFIALVQIDTLDTGAKRLKFKKEAFSIFPENMKVDLNIKSSDSIIVKNAVIHSEMLNGEVLVGFSTKTIQENIKRIKTTSFIGSFIVSVLGIIIGFILARNISKPILKLRDAHLKVGEGDLQQSVVVKSRDEIGQLAVSFNQMVEKLDKAEKQLQFQKARIEEKNKEIIDSISYAKRIQYSLLGDIDLIKQHLPNHFIFFQPKDIVSGDFYWASILPNHEFGLVAADSTGHGVPGAIMSMLNISSLNEAVIGQKITAPAEILNYTRKKIIENLMHDGSTEGGSDGMDCCFMSFNFEKMTVTYAGANNPLWILRNNQILEFTPDKMPVGKHNRDTISFKQQIIPIQKNDVIYSMTDGLPDQFGGPYGKKYKYGQLKSLLLKINGLAMNDQRKAIEESFEIWKGDMEQIDDVCVIGVRI